MKKIQSKTVDIPADEFLKALGVSEVEPTLLLPDPYLVEAYVDDIDRHIYINYEIDTLTHVCKQIIKYNKMDTNIPVEERKKIYIYIDTPGGDLVSTFSLMGIIAASKTPVVTINIGSAMSAGGLILLAGHERYCLKRSTVLIHQGEGGFQGTPSQLEESRKYYDQLLKDAEEFILERTTIDRKLYNRNKKKEWYINSEQQLEWGIVDKIVENIYDII